MPQADHVLSHPHCPKPCQKRQGRGPRRYRSHLSAIDALTAFLDEADGDTMMKMMAPMSHRSLAAVPPMTLNTSTKRDTRRAVEMTAKADDVQDEPHVLNLTSPAWRTQTI